MASVGGTEGGEPEFQIAPMIDVLLVLLIFFMSITSAEVLKIDKDIVLPISAHAKKREAEMAKHEMAVNVRGVGAEKKAYVKVDDKDYPYPELTELVPEFKKRLAADKRLRVIIRGDGALPASIIQVIMGQVAAGGIADVTFAASNK